jgi:zinc finger SWIM domain-containing protein 3
VKGNEKDEVEAEDENEAEDKIEGEDEESRILRDFSACMYSYEDKEEFQEAFDIMRTKVHKQTWLDSIYKVKEKWAECYKRDVFSLGVRSTQLSESFNNALKNHLKSDFDIVRFLKHFERTVQKREKELESEFQSRKKLPRRQMCTPMLVQASQVYTPIIFEALQSEYERSMAACARVLDGDNKYAIAIGSLRGDLSFEQERIVIGDPLNQTVSCSCGMFNRSGILCAHGLKVLDLMNIKILLAHYILKRWTREARNGSIQDSQGRNVIENPKREALLRYKFLSLKFKHAMAVYKIAKIEM